MEKHPKNQNAFTLVELLVALLIIGLLAAIAIPVFQGQRAKAKDAKTKSVLINTVGAFKNIWLASKEQYGTSSVSEASDNEKGFNIVASSPVSYKKKEVTSDVPDTRTMVAVQKSDSGRDFCIVSKEGGPNAGVYRSWEIADASVLQKLGCPPSADMVLGSNIVNYLPEDGSASGGSTSGGTTTTPTTTTTTAAPATTTTTTTPTTTTPTTTTPAPTTPDYGNYIAVRNSLGTNATCPFDEAIVKDYLDMYCTGGVTGQYKDKYTRNGTDDDYKIQEPGSLFYKNGSGAVVNDTTNASVYFTGSRQHYSTINNNNKMPLANDGSTNIDWSIEVWAKPKTLGTAGIIGTDYGFGFTMLPTGFSTNVKQADPTGQFGGYKTQTLNGAATMQANKWYHLVTTWNNGSLKFYINGKQASEATIGKLKVGSDNLAVGYNQDSPGGNNRFNGWIDEFSYYGKTLTAAQVKSLYEAGAQTAVQ